MPDYNSEISLSKCQELLLKTNKKLPRCVFMVVLIVTATLGDIYIFLEQPKSGYVLLCSIIYLFSCTFSKKIFLINGTSAQCLHCNGGTTF